MSAPKDKLERDMKRLIELEERHKKVRAKRPGAPKLAAQIDRLRKKLKLPAVGDRPYNHQRTNTERSLEAEAALRLFAERTGQPEDLEQDPRAPIADLICNLRHFADRHDVRWEAVMESAKTNYDAERYCGYCKSREHGTDECLKGPDSPQDARQ